MGSKIISLKSENVKRLVAVEIKPNGELVVLGGKNGAGKSSVIDSIEYALAGGKSLPKVPIRRGQHKASVEIDLGDMVIKRTFTAGGTSLTVTNKEGLKYPSPQAILDALVGRLSFDPLAFARGTKPEDDRRRSDTLRALVGLDLSKLDAERQIVFNKRTIVNRDAESLRVRLVSTPAVEAPDAEVSTVDVLKKQQDAAGRNASNAAKRNQVVTAKQAVDLVLRKIEKTKEDISSIHEEIKQLQARLQKCETELASLQTDLKSEQSVFETVQATANALKDEDLSAFQKQLSDAEATNGRVRQKKSRAELETQFKSKTGEADVLTKEIEAVDVKKREAIKAAKYPIDGLTVGEDGDVYFSDLPFSQASSAEQLRISVAIGMALNPKLRVLLIRDGSLLDAESLKMVADMAAKADAQVWMERVSEGGEVSVIIEDGHVQGVTPPSDVPVEGQTTEEEPKLI